MDDVILPTDAHHDVLRSLEVRLVFPEERQRWNALMQEHDSAFIP